MLAFRIRWRLRIPGVQGLALADSSAFVIGGGVLDHGLWLTARAGGGGCLCDESDCGNLFGSKTHGFLSTCTKRFYFTRATGSSASLPSTGHAARPSSDAATRCRSPWRMSMSQPPVAAARLDVEVKTAFHVARGTPLGNAWTARCHIPTLFSATRCRSPTRMME